MAFEFFNFSLILQVFILLNPLTTVPVLVSAYMQKVSLPMIIVKSTITAFAVAFLVILVGDYLFALFGISINGFRIAGGIVLFLLSLSKINPSKTEREYNSADNLISIIATPLLTGPGIISFLAIKSLEIGKATVLANIIYSFVLVAITLLIFAFFIAKINLRVVDVVSRVFGLFLAGVAIEMIAAGIHGLITSGAL